MNKLITCLLVLCCFSINAQILEVPTLSSMGITSAAKKVEVNQYDFIKDKGLTLTQIDIETYDDSGRLVSIDREVLSSSLSYLYTYKLNRKGLLEQEKIVNSANNETVRTTDYSYKKGLVVKTTQVQGTVTLIKNYTYDKKGHMVGIEAIENGTKKGQEFYKVDDQGRRTSYSQQLPTEEAARSISSFSYKTEGNIEVKTETRNVKGVKYEIVARKDLGANRTLKETTRNLSNNQSGFNNFIFESDEKGSWIKGEIIDNQFGRSRLKLRQITYSDGSITGRTKMISKDGHARYYRQNSQYQVLYNGRVTSTGVAESLSATGDRLVYSAVDSAMILLKGYDDKAFQNNWHEAQILSHGKDSIIWFGKESGINAYKKGRRLVPGTNSNSPIKTAKIGSTIIAYATQGIEKTFVARDFNSEDNLGKHHYPEYTNEHAYWGKASDSTYKIVSHGNSISIRKQAEDKSGNFIVQVVTGDWYSLKGFREKFDNEKPGDIFSALLLEDPLSQIKEQSLFEADFTTFRHDNFKKKQYTLKTADGLNVTSLAMQTLKTRGNELITYFPLTKQYLKMDGYYAAANEAELTDQSVSVLLAGHENGYYIYNDGGNIEFFQEGRASTKYRFGAHTLRKETKHYGAVLYDSARNVTYGMNYDLANGDGMGRMKKLPIIKYNVYLLKLAEGRWVIFNSGGKLGNYDNSTIDGGAAVFFFKDHGNKIGAYRFDGYDKAEMGDFIASEYITGKEAIALSERLQINPLIPKEQEKRP